MVRICLAGVIAAVLVALPFQARANTCNVLLCNAQITTSQYTGPIDFGCDLEDIKVKVVINYNCPGGSGTATFYRCGESSNIYRFVVGETAYIVGVSGTWADALNCSNVSFVPEQ